MVNFKLTVSDKKGKSISRELKEADANSLVGLRLGDEIDAALVGQLGKMRITGGSDKSGVPMRADIHGGVRKYVLLSKGVGLQNAERGERIRKLIRGSTITEEIFQVNCSLSGELVLEESKPQEKPQEKAPEKKEESKKPQEKPQEKAPEKKEE